MKTFKQYNLLIEGSDWLILKSLDASKKGSMVIDSRTGVIFHMANLATEYTFKSDEWNKIYDMLDDNDTNMVDEVTKDLNESINENDEWNKNTQDMLINLLKSFNLNKIEQQNSQHELANDIINMLQSIDALK